MPSLPGVSHARAVRALRKAGFSVKREGKHIVRDAFRSHAKAYWTAISRGDSDAANEATRAGDLLVASWGATPRVLELLVPLLDEVDPEIRFAAASRLADEGHQRALGVLEELAADPKGLVAPTAKLRLIVIRRARSSDETA